MKAPRSITVSSSPAFAEAVAAELARHEAVVLDLAELEEVDLSFVQIVCAARELAARQAKSLGIAGSFPPAVEQLLRRGGFLDKPAAEDIGFWFNGAAPR
ncbi:STAS domain-containing protein [Sphingomonas swuensis]|uniref:STAS domain-containing protein n=1 Tax=Sphingomonas swuensis TaxID=977800 RepID=UPI0031CFA4F9